MIVVPDNTLGGYLEKHSRPPAFQGSDGISYSVDTYITEGDPDGKFCGALLFVRWSDDGTQPVGHLETRDLIASDKRVDVTRHLHALTLFEIKSLLERVISESKVRPEW